MERLNFIIFSYRVLWRKCIRLCFKNRTMTFFILLILAAVSCIFMLMTSNSDENREVAFNTGRLLRTVSKMEGILVLKMKRILGTTSPGDRILLTAFEPEKEELDGMARDIMDTLSGRWMLLSYACHVPWGSSHLHSTGNAIMSRIPQPRCSLGPTPATLSNDSAIFLAKPYNPLRCCFIYPDKFDCQPIPPQGAQIITDTGSGPDHVIVRCSPHVLLKSMTYFPFIPIKPQVEEHCASVRQTEPSSHRRPSVLLLGLGGLSRAAFHYQMPVFSSLLRYEGAIEMRGYTVANADSYANMMAMLSGIKVDTLPKDCWTATQDNRTRCSFVWQEFKKQGYRTMMASDCPEMGDFERKVRREQATDYDFRYISVHAGISSSHMRSRSGGGLCFVCSGDYTQVELLLSYVEKFVNRFRQERYWAMAWSRSLTQDDVAGANRADHYYTHLLTKALDENLLNNTILIVVSDRGSKEDGFSDTYKGQMELRLPLLSILLPRWFKEEYPRETRLLEASTLRLTSPYDLHATLLHLANLPPPSNETDEEAAEAKENDWDVIEETDNVVHPSEKPRPSYTEMQFPGHSLLRPLPWWRSCEDAGIASTWCPCHELLYSYDPIVAADASNYLVSFVNKALEPFEGRCQTLSVREVQGLWDVVRPQSLKPPPLDRRAQTQTLLYSLKVSVWPFAATTLHANVLWLSNPQGDYHWYTHMNAIEVQTYNKTNTNLCIDDVILSKFCYCSEDGMDLKREEERKHYEDFEIN